MMELEIEREEQQKALQLLQEVRQKEREELNRAIAEAHQEGGQYADQVRNEMAARIEKQVQMIEALLEDKRALQESVEQVTEKAQDLQMSAEKQKKVLEERLHVELKKNREAWLAAEKVRKEKWEKDKVQEIRA
jgi:5-azacytidine-induced protein 1